MTEPDSKTPIVKILGAVVAVVLGLIGFGFYSSYTTPSRPLSAMQSYAISEAEPAGAVVQDRFVQDSGKNLLGGGEASIFVTYTVNDDFSREEVITQLLDAAEADGWTMSEEELIDRTSWIGGRPLNDGSTWVIFLRIESLDADPSEVRLRLSSLYLIDEEN